MSFRLLIKVVALASTCWLSVSQAWAENRIALVIGNSSYKSVTALPNPANDAKAMTRFLASAGFQVLQAPDLTQSDMRRTFGNFASLVAEKGPDTVALVFYAGHGLQVDGENYLVPVDASIQREADVPLQAMRLADLMNALASVSAKTKLVILDACRNNPFGAKMAQSVRTRSVMRGLAQVEPSGNVLVAFAAKDGTLAADGGGRNSPFTEALLKHIETPGLEINFLFRNVRDDVIRTTNRIQQPFVYGSLSKEAIYLNPPTPGLVAPPVAPSPAADEIAWAFIKDNKDAAALKRFIEQFPTSRLRPQAEARIEELARKVQPAQRMTTPTTPKRGDAKCFSFQGRQFCE
jgi:uncharacterized caspase-like protein